jgi:hypothetical protein
MSLSTEPLDQPQRESTIPVMTTKNDGLNTQVDAEDHVDTEQFANAKSELDLPTDSHALVHEELEEKGLIHKVSKAEDETFAGAADVGWTQEPHEFEEQIVGGIKNDDLWTLIRRFNKVTILFNQLVTYNRLTQLKSKFIMSKQLISDHSMILTSMLLKKVMYFHQINFAQRLSVCISLS